MATENSRYLKLLRYSGASIIVTLNPLHWRWLPQARREHNTEWPSPNEVTYMASWIFLTVRLWIDDGAW
jgi:hypothetical protein